LKEKAFQDNPDPNYWPPLDMNAFGKDYPRYPSIKTVKIPVNDRNKYINLTPYMNLTPYLIQKNATVDRVFRLFRTMGLRHLPVVNEFGAVVGMITRRDLVNFEERIEKKKEKANSKSQSTDNIPLLSHPPDFDMLDDLIPEFSSFPKSNIINERQEHNPMSSVSLHKIILDSADDDRLPHDTTDDDTHA